MRDFLIRRILLALLTVFLSSLLIFGSIRLLPGDAISAATDPSGGQGISKEQAKVLRRELGLEDPLPVQYWNWSSGLLTGDMGKSAFSGRPVSELVKQAVPVSIELALLALFLGGGIGFLLGVAGAVTRGTPVDYLTRIVATLGITLPSFVIGLVVLLVGVREFDWIPPTRYVSITKDTGSNLSQFIIPSLILAFALSAGLARITRSSMLEVLSADYVRTARAKGLRGRVVLSRHVFRNALIPIVTVVGLQMATTLGGSVVMESIFNLPGLGRLVLNGISNRDYPVIQAGVLVIACYVVFVNLLVDISYGFIDPRIGQR